MPALAPQPPAVPADRRTDEALAAAARGGSAAAFEELVRRYQLVLLRFLQRRVPREAEDVLQEAFLRAYRALPSYRDGRPFKPWLFTIAYRLAVDTTRRPRLAVNVDADPVAAAVDPGRAEAAEHLWAAVRRAVGDEPFTAVWLHYADGLPPREVAAVMGRSGAWVRTTLHRARKQLAAVLDRPG